MAVQNNQIWTGLQALPTFDLYAQLYLQPLDPIRANYTTIPYKNLQLGTFWLTTTTVTGKAKQGNLWYLASLTLPPHIEGHWIQISGSTGTVEFLSGNSGGPIGPDGSANINVIGDGTTINVVGKPGTNTLTISAVGTGTVESLHTDDGNTVTPTAGVINLSGTHGLNTTGTVGPNTATVAINNAITLGDLTPLAANAGALTATTGDVIITAGDLTLPNTNAAGNQGIIKFGGNNFVSNYGQNNTFVGQGSGNQSLTVVSAVNNTCIGAGTGTALTTSPNNTMLGVAAGTALAGGSGHNTLIGYQNGKSMTSGNNNASFGYQSMTAATTATNVLAIGTNSAGNLLTSDGITCIGVNTGVNYTTSESYNILIGYDVAGNTGESNVLRIGNGTGTGTAQLNKAFISGIRGITTTNNDAVAVLIDSAGQLGTISSSLRYKENIESINEDSVAIMSLRPVVFNYKNHTTKDKQYGLIAEEVEKVLPELVVYDSEGQPDTIKYQHLPILLLNELQKQHKIILDLMNHVGILESEIQKMRCKH